MLPKEVEEEEPQKNLLFCWMSCVKSPSHTHPRSFPGLLCVSRGWRSLYMVILRNLGEPGVKSSTTGSPVGQLASLRPSLPPPLSYQNSSEEKHVFVTQRWRSRCLALLLMTYLTCLSWLTSIQKHTNKQTNKKPGRDKYEKCNESPAMRSTDDGKRKNPRNSASHGAAPTERGELFVTEPFHMQIACPWVLLIQHSTLALGYMLCTRGLFRANCPGLLEAPVCGSKHLIWCVSASLKVSPWSLIVK